MCLVSCWDLQPGSRGVSLKGTEKTQALASSPSAFGLNELQGSLPLGSLPSKAVPHSVEHSPPKVLPSCWLGLRGSPPAWLSGPPPWGLETKAAGAPGKDKRVRDSSEEPSAQSILARLPRTQCIGSFGGVRPFAIAGAGKAGHWGRALSPWPCPPPKPLLRLCSGLHCPLVPPLGEACRGPQARGGRSPALGLGLQC